jgi:predicted AAA+ superfamily ATPase
LRFIICSEEKISIEKVPSAKPIIQNIGLSTLPRVNVAVLVGTALDPSKSRRPNNFPGITINTLWGELAAQLAESAGNAKLYDYVKEADRKGVSPGSETLKNLFDACGPCMVLVDELVAYAKKLYGVNGLPAGSFDNLVSFIQEITEAARASKNSLVVALSLSLKLRLAATPESKCWLLSSIPLDAWRLFGSPLQQARALK